MKHIKELKAIFDRLPMSIGNLALYTNLLDLDRTVFKPLMEEIIAGRLDIEDTRPIFNINLEKFRTETVKRLKLINTEADLRSNLSNRVFNPSLVAKEATLSRLDIEDIRDSLASDYTERTGLTLSKTERDAILVAFNAMKDIDAVYAGSKTDQQKYTDALSVKPIMDV